MLSALKPHYCLCLYSRGSFDDIEKLYECGVQEYLVCQTVVLELSLECSVRGVLTSLDDHGISEYQVMAGLS